MSDSEETKQAAYSTEAESEEIADTPAISDYAQKKEAENGTSVIVEPPRLQTQTSVLDEGDDIDVECSSVANAADALKAQQEVIRNAEQNEEARKVSRYALTPVYIFYCAESPRTPKISRVNKFNLFHEFNTFPTTSSKFIIVTNTSGIFLTQFPSKWLNETKLKTRSEASRQNISDLIF